MILYRKNSSTFVVSRDETSKKLEMFSLYKMFLNKSNDLLHP